MTLIQKGLKVTKLIHFQSLDHNGFLEDTEITFIDKTDPSDPTRCEEFWIDTLKTHYPLGLNNIDAYH